MGVNYDEHISNDKGNHDVVVPMGRRPQPQTNVAVNNPPVNVVE